MAEIAVAVKRGSLVENFIRADIAVVSADGRLLASLGDVQKYTYMRSCSKPIQALVPVLAGIKEKYALNEKELAIMCASHNGEAFHVEAVRSVLQKIGLDESYLQCGPAYSFGNPKVTEEYMRKGIPPMAVINNCSGKHSAMLALCQAEGYDTSNYFKPEHPVQQRILAKLAEISEYPQQQIEIGVDGCGVPVFALPIFNMALAYAKFADMPETAADRVAAERLCTAMTNNPEMIAGTGSFTSELMRVAQGRLIAKEGADGVYCIGMRGGNLGIAIKCEDGNLTHISCIAMSVLKQLQLLTDMQLAELEHFRLKANRNCRSEVIGSVEPVFVLTKA